mmetsp:Transcript_37985/g.96106  ORF Transcript_37985/g.96106 Transcript_37985/m.96106 type:complete len:283 (+) Transcript_37985:374-1222(+)
MYLVYTFVYVCIYGSIYTSYIHTHMYIYRPPYIHMRRNGRTHKTYPSREAHRFNDQSMSVGGHAPLIVVPTRHGGKRHQRVCAARGAPQPRAHGRHAAHHRKRAARHLRAQSQLLVHRLRAVQQRVAVLGGHAVHDAQRVERAAGGLRLPGRLHYRQAHGAQCVARHAGLRRPPGPAAPAAVVAIARPEARADDGQFLRRRRAFQNRHGDDAVPQPVMGPLEDELGDARRGAGHRCVQPLQRAGLLCLQNPHRQVDRHVGAVHEARQAAPAAVAILRALHAL